MGGSCDERCAYSYQYDISTTCTATNVGQSIILGYDAGSTTPVLFNNIKYSITHLEIYSPSLHSYNNTLADAEIVITHTSQDTGSPLLVCIPITAGNDTNETVSTILADIVAKPLHSGDPSMAISLPNYNLNDIVPSKPFFYYISQTKNTNVIVYSIGDSIKVNSDTLEALKTLVSPATSGTLQPSEESYLFFNHTGPKKTSGGGGMSDGQIYIDCSPTGNSQVSKDVEFKKTPSTKPYAFDLGLDSLMTPENIYMSIFVVIFVIMLYAINHGIRAFST